MKLSEGAFSDLVRERLAELGTTPFAVETAHNLPTDAIRNVLRTGQKSGPTLKRVEELCEALGLELYIGPRRDPSPPPAADDTFVAVPLHDAVLAAGAGALNDAEPVIGALAFRREWLRDLGMAPSSARLARAQGDSMAPTIRDRDMVMIDTGARQLPDAPRAPTDTRCRPIFSLLDQGAARLKRVERIDARHFLLLSDNPDFAPEVRPVSAIEPIGRVRWWGHTARE